MNSYKTNASVEEAVRDEVVEVTTDDIAEVIASMTGIPISRLAKTETERLLAMEDVLTKKIVGQQQAITAVCAGHPSQSRGAYRIPSGPSALLSFSARQAWVRPSWPSGWPNSSSTTPMR